jgi:hypothetical protein
MSSSVKPLGLTLLVVAAGLLACAVGIPVAEALEWDVPADTGFVGLLLAFAGALAGALGLWLRLTGPRAPVPTRALTHLTMWVAMPIVFVGCLTHAGLQIWEARQSLNEA